MKRCLIIFALLYAQSWAATYYVDPQNTLGTSADTNNGTAKATAWIHAPGMVGCASTCNSTTLNAGDNIIVRGGTTIPNSYLPWVAPARNGTNGNVIYWGVDLTWFVGGSFTRPVVDQGNPLSTTTVSSCTSDQHAIFAFSFHGTSWNRLDNFEFKGHCSSRSSSNGGYVTWGNGGSNLEVSNSYFHGWTLTSTATDDSDVWVGGPNSGVNTGNQIDNNVFDGADSTYGTACNTPSCVPSHGLGTNSATGWAIEGDCPNVHHNVIRHVSNGIQCGNILIVHDNMMEYEFDPTFGGGIPPPCGGSCRHGNYLEAVGGIAGGTCLIYNNIQRHGFQGTGFWPQCSTAYIYNNVFEDLSNGGNALMLSPPGFSSGAVLITVFLANNTFDGTSSIRGFGGNGSTPHWANGSSITVQNTHVLDRTSIFTGGSKLFNCESTSICAETDGGGEIFQTTAVANGQGYTLSNDFQPTSGGSTIQAGNNASSSCGSGFTNDLCSGTSNGVSEASGSGGLVVSYPAITVNLRGSNWDTGAYQFPSSGVTITNPTNGCTQPCVITGGTNGTAYAGFTFTQSGGTSCTWSVTSGSFQTGLSLSSGGVLSGTPTQTSTATPTVQVSCSGGNNASVQVSLTIAPSGSGGVEPATGPTKIILLQGGSK